MYGRASNAAIRSCSERSSASPPFDGGRRDAYSAEARPERRPKTIDDLHEVYGVGAKKAADFGDAFLDAIRTFRRPE